MFKRIYPVISLFILCLFLCSWGSVGHRIINSKCSLSFPASMVGFQVWSDSLASNASNADNRKSTDKTESPKHFIDIDSYTEFVSTGRIASTYDSIVARHGSSFVVNNGTLPWATMNMYDTLKVDFQKLRWHKAMLDASDLGHYIADGHMPLHLTSNYDGGATNQRGIHSRYESDMVSTYQSDLSNYTTPITPANFVSNVNKYIFDYIYKDNKYVDSVLSADIYARNLDPAYNSTYIAALWSKTQFTKTLFFNSSHSLAELIYSAWVEAGSPPFGAKTFTNAVNYATADAISVYPNPTTGHLNLNGENILKTEVFTITGTSIGSYYNKQIDLGNLPKGMYILNIYGKEGLLKKQKIIQTK